MRSHMEEVAKMLDVAVGEVFRIDEGAFILPKYYQFTEVGFLQSEDRVMWSTAKSADLFRLLVGFCSVVKLPWRPKVGDFYYVPRPDLKELYTTLRWEGTENDLHRYEHGLVYKLASTAIESAEKVLDTANGGIYS